jgi:hypothetical protein
MLSFTFDMVNSYGKDMKAIVDREFITKLLSKLKAFKIKKFESDISFQEQVLINLLN